MQKLIIALVFILFLAGCEKEFDTIIDTTNPQYQVNLVAPTDSVLFNSADSLIVIRLNFSEPYNFQQVFCNIIDPAQNNLNSSPIILFDDGNSANGDQAANDGKYSAKFPMSAYYANGYYDIKYYVSDETSTNKQVALSRFKYDNGRENIAPEISNLILVDSVNVGIQFTFSIFVQDANGYSDINKVYFELFRPDGTIVQANGGETKFLMYDDGNVDVNGDVTRGDGIFSFRNSFLDDSTTQRGFWRFEFQANDRSGALSNKLTKNVKVL